MILLCMTTIDDVMQMMPGDTDVKKALNNAEKEIGSRSVSVLLSNIDKLTKHWQQYSINTQKNYMRALKKMITLMKPKLSADFYNRTFPEIEKKVSELDRMSNSQSHGQRSKLIFTSIPPISSKRKQLPSIIPSPSKPIVIPTKPEYRQAPKPRTSVRISTPTPKKDIHTDLLEMENRHLKEKLELYETILPK